MTTEHSLEVRAERALAPYEDPKAVRDRAKAQADVLMEIVTDRKLYAVIQGKKYLEAEAWQTILAFDNACPITEYATPMLDKEGEVIGYTAKVNITKNGEVVASGIMSCGFEEFPCQGRKGIAQHRAAMSAAATWAGAKAARMRYAWVAVLAGFEPTPAAEMERGNEAPAQRPEQLGDYWCKEHNTAWFLRGKMKSYAHPRGQGEQWCYKPETAVAQEQAQAAQGQAEEPAAAPVAGAEPAPASSTAGGAAARQADDWTAFYPAAKALGYPDGKAVSAKLGMMPDAWLRAAPGRTLAKALAILEEKP